MNKQRLFSVVAAALVVGVVGGNVISGWAAAPAATTGTSTTAPAAGMGLRLGSAMRAGGARLVDVVAKLTGLDVADVTAKRAAGASFATIAAAEGVASDKVVDSAIATRKAILGEKVKAGTITSAQADAALVTMKARLTERVTSTDASCDASGGGMGGGRGMGGRGRGAGSGARAGAGCTAGTAPATQ